LPYHLIYDLVWTPSLKAEKLASNRLNHGNIHLLFTNNKITETLAFVGRCYRPSVTMGYKLP